jgi:hypothetical protein
MGFRTHDGGLLLQCLDVLQGFLPLLLERLLLRAHGGPLGEPHDGGYVEPQLVWGRDVGCLCVVGTAQKYIAGTPARPTPGLAGRTRRCFLLP